MQVRGFGDQPIRAGAENNTSGSLVKQEACGVSFATISKRVAKLGISIVAEFTDPNSRSNAAASGWSIASIEAIGCPTALSPTSPQSWRAVQKYGLRSEALRHRFGAMLQLKHRSDRHVVLLLAVAGLGFGLWHRNQTQGGV